IYGQIVKELDLLPNLPIKKETTKISLQVRENDDEKYLFVQNFSHEQQSILLKQKMKEMLSDEFEENKVIVKPYGTKIYQMN
ncbi:beta-galactosidase, partial [Bacillus thuringiensis]